MKGCSRCKEKVNHVYRSKGAQFCELCWPMVGRYGYGTGRVKKIDESTLGFFSWLLGLRWLGGQRELKRGKV